MSPRWGPPCVDDHDALVRLVADVVGDRNVTDTPEEVAGCVARLADASLWTVGVAEEHGGGGADFAQTATVLASLAGSWAALAWASAQAHAAGSVLAGRSAWEPLLTGLHEGRTPVAVADLGSGLTATGNHVHGTVERIDPAGSSPHVVALMDESTAMVLTPDQLTYSPVRRRTGFAGARTVSASVNAVLDEDAVLTGVDVLRARSLLHRLGAAVAAGLADAAATASLAYSHERHQFGAPLTALPTVRHSLFGQVSDVVATLTSATSADLSSPTQSAAVLQDACERAITTCANAVQSHGGYGYLREYPLERLLRDAVSLRAATAALVATHAEADALVGLPRLGRQP